MSFSKAVSDMDAALFNEFSEVGIYNGTEKVQVVIDLDVEQFGSFDTQAAVRRHEISFLHAEIPAPKRGQFIVTDQGTFKLDGSISSDGKVSRWNINES